MSSNELTSCPFCGRLGDPKLKQDRGFWRVMCDNCGASSYRSSIKENVLAVWNERAVSSDRAVEAASPAVPGPEVVEFLIGLLDEAAEDIGMNPNFYTEPDVEMAKIEAARAWLQQLQEGDGDGS